MKIKKLKEELKKELLEYEIELKKFEHYLLEPINTLVNPFWSIMVILEKHSFKPFVDNDKRLVIKTGKRNHGRKITIAKIKYSKYLNDFFVKSLCI